MQFIGTVAAKKQQRLYPSALPVKDFWGGIVIHVGGSDRVQTGYKLNNFQWDFFNLTKICIAIQRHCGIR